MSTIRAAAPDEAPRLAALINDAFVVEAFFKVGDRTSAEEVVALIAAGGEFLVLDSEAGSMLGCLYLKCAGDRAYLGMLSIEPVEQGKGLGRRLIAAAEDRARDRACRSMDIHIVNLREELPGYYRRLGYSEQGLLPFTDVEQTSRPCHFVVMSKPLSAPGPGV